MASAETIAKGLSGRKNGAGWMARCPAHDDRRASLTIILTLIDTALKIQASALRERGPA